MTGDTAKACEKLMRVTEHMNFEGLVTHCLKLRHDLNVAMQLDRMLPKMTPSNLPDGTLSRLLVLPQSAVLAGVIDTRWGKTLAKLHVVRPYMQERLLSQIGALYSPVTSTPITRNIRVLEDNTDFFGPCVLVMNGPGVGYKPPATIEVPLLSTMPEQATVAPSVQNWMQNVPAEAETGGDAGTNPNGPEAGAAVNDNEPVRIGAPAAEVSPEVEPPVTSANAAPRAEPVATPLTQTWAQSASDAMWTDPQSRHDPWAVHPPRFDDRTMPALASARSNQAVLQSVENRSNVQFAADARNVGRGRGRAAFNNNNNNRGNTRGRGFNGRGVQQYMPNNAESAPNAWSNRGVSRGQAPNARGGMRGVTNEARGGSRGRILNVRGGARGDSSQTRGTDHANRGNQGRGGPQAARSRTATLHSENDSPSLNRNESVDPGPELIRTMRQKAPTGPAPSIARSSRASTTASTTATVRQSQASNATQDKKTGKVAAQKVNSSTTKLNRSEVEACVRMEEAAIREAHKAFVVGMQAARMHRGKLNFVAEIGQIFLQEVPKGIKGLIPREEFVAAMKELKGFDQKSSNFTDLVTTNEMDCAHIMGYLGIPIDQASYEHSSVLELDCNSLSHGTIKLVIDAQANPKETYATGHHTMFSSFYGHHPFRTFDQRIVVAGDEWVDIEKGSKLQRIRDSVYARFGENNIDVEVQGADGPNVKVEAIRMVQYVRYAVASPSSPDNKRFYMQFQRTFDLRVLRRDAGPGDDRQFFYARNTPMAEMIEQQRFYCRVCIGQVDEPWRVDGPSDDVEIGELADWSPEECASEDKFRDLHALATTLVDKMDCVGAKNRGFAAAYEARKKEEFDEKMAKPDVFW